MTMLNPNKKLNEIIAEMDAMNAALLRMTGLGHDDTPKFAVVLVQGEATTADVLALLDAYDSDDEQKENPVRAMVAGPQMLKALSDLIDLFEMDDEANTPGTDSYTALVLAREARDAAMGGAA
jgi:hypothetical protein